VLKTLRTVVLETFRGFQADRGIDLAASLAFTTLLTAIPLLATFSLLVAAFFEENAAEVLAVINRILPYHTESLTESLQYFIAQSTALSGIGLFFLVLTSVRLIFVVEATINAVWGAPRRRAWLARSAIHTLVLVVLALLTGVIALGIHAFPHIVSIPLVEHLFPFTVELLALTLLYRFLPNAWVSYRSAGLAAAVVSVLLESLRALFAVYVDVLSRMNLITGSLTFALLLLVSIYFVWVLILLGVELTHVLQTMSEGRAVAGGARAGMAENAIRMLLRLSSGKREEFRSLYREQDASTMEAERILRRLVERKLVEGDAGRGFAIARRPEEITIASVVEAIAPDLYTVTPEEGDRVVRVLGPLFQRLDAERRHLLGVTLAELREG
jgi:membrane protein